jgi:hypothetical protein
LAIRAQAKATKPDETPLRDLIPTMHFDAQLIAETEHALASFGEVKADVLLLGGARSASYLRRALDALERVLPHARRVELAGLGHLSADNGGKPLIVAETLRAFFA